MFNWLKIIQYESGELKIKLFQKGAYLLSGLFNGFKPVKRFINLPSFGNPEIGRQLAEDQYIFAGVQFDLNVDNPWLIEIPSLEVEQSLHGFFWLNDLAFLGNSRARSRAREWIQKWHFYNSFGKQIGWDADIAALRSINLLRNWKFLKQGLNKNIDSNLKLLWRQFKFLKLMYRVYPVGLKKATILYSVFLLSIVFDLPVKNKKKILKKLAQTLMSCVDLDGQIVSRSPEDFLGFFIIIIEILNFNGKENLINNNELQLLLGLKKTMAPILRGLRLGDGSLTRTHGGDVGSIGIIDRYLVNSKVKDPPAITNILGFERITAGRLVLIVDCAKPYTGIDAYSSHASCLAFELSSGQRPIFVNCGPGGRFGGAFKRYCQSTQAHNSCTLGDISQSQFEFISRKNRWPKEIIVHGPRNILINREKTLEATWLNLSHDSYENKYGYVHHRKLFVLNSGKVLTGTDSFETTKTRKTKDKKVSNFYAYFQLHPDVELWDHPRLQTIIFRLKNGEHWIFESDLGTVDIQESTFINSFIAKPQNTKRIVIKSSTLLNRTEIKWSLRRREIVTRNTRDADVVR